MSDSFRQADHPDWFWKGLGAWSTEDIVEQLKTYGVEIDRERFRQAAQSHRASQTLADEFFYPQATLPPSEEDFIWMAALELWKRWPSVGVGPIAKTCKIKPRNCDGNCIRA